MNKDSQVAVGDGRMPIPAVFRQLQRMASRAARCSNTRSMRENPLPGLQKCFAYMRGFSRA
jgi:hypothetical protein